MRRKKKSQTSTRQRQSEPHTPEPEELVKSEAGEQNPTNSKNASPRHQSGQDNPTPPRWWSRAWRWLKSKEPHLAVWLPVITSVVLLVITWVYARYAKKQWETMERQGQTMERSLYVSERAYVAIDSIQMDLDKGEVTIKLHNIGKSPAGDLEFHAYVNEVRAVKELTLGDARGLATFDSDWGHTSLYSGSLKTVVVMPLQNFTPENAELVRKGKLALYIGGSIQYWDGFKKAEPNHFAYRYIPPPYDLWMNVPINSFEELQQMK